MAQQARVLTHVGLVVSDIHAAVAWYSSVLGFVALAPPVLLSADSHAGRVAAAIYGERFGSCKQAQLMAGNGVGLELFEFLEPPTAPGGGEFEYWRAGLFHICVVDPEIEALQEVIARRLGYRLVDHRLELYGIPLDKAEN